MTDNSGAVTGHMLQHFDSSDILMVYQARIVVDG